MQYPEITFSTIICAFRNCWKVFCAVVLIFALLGIGAGFLFSDKLSSSALGKYQGPATLSFETIHYDTDYYSSCRQQLIVHHSDLETIVSRGLSESTLTDVQQQQLQEILEQLDDFEYDYLKPLAAKWSLPEAIYVPEEFLDDLVADYTIDRENTRTNLYAAEVAVDLIKSMDAPDVATEAINSTYNTLLSRASQYAQLQTNLQRYDTLLEQLQQNRDAVVAEGREMERQLEQAKDALNVIHESMERTLGQITTDNHLNIVAKYVGDDLQVTIDHTYATSSSREAFQIIVLFCTLTGVCVGLFGMVCLEAKRSSGKGEPPQQKYVT